MAELKTKPNRAGVRKFLGSIEDARKRRDSLTLLGVMEEISGARPTMWGDGIVGFGTYRYRYASGREGEWFVTGFSPRKQALTVYLMCDLAAEQPLLDKLGKYKLGKSCLYIKKLDDIDEAVLRKLIERRWAEKAPRN